MEPDEAAILHNFIRGQDSSDDMVAIIPILRDLLGVDGILRIVDWLGRGADILPIRFLGDQTRREWPVRLVPVHSPGILAPQDADILLSIDHPNPLFFYQAVFTGLTGEVTEWPIVHDWKSCVPYKGTEGSNPSLSAKVHNILEKGIGLHSCLSCASM